MILKNMTEVRKLYKKKREQVINDEDEHERIETLDVLFENDGIFFELDYVSAVGILVYIGLTEDEAMKSYENLVSYENYKKDKYVTISTQK